MLCIDRARHPGRTKKSYVTGDLARHIRVEVLNLGGWLIDGDCDVLLIAET